MEHSSPNFYQMGWLDGKYARGRATNFLPSKEAKEEYKIGYDEGVAQRRAERGPPRPSGLPSHTPIA